MPGKYTKDPLKPVYHLNKEQFAEITNSKPLTKILCEQESPILVTDYVIRSDNRVGHEMGWEELGMITKKLDNAFRNGLNIDDIFQVKQVKRENVIKPGFMEIILPNMEALLKTNTVGYLVLVAKDRTNIIMPKYYDFMMEKMKHSEPKGLQPYLSKDTA